MMECAGLLFAALELLAVLALVHFRMVQLLDGSVTLRAPEAKGACSHISLVLYVLAVFRTIIEDDRRSSKVAHVVRIDAVF